MPFELLLAYFMPILAFLLVFILIYAFLAKTKILGESAGLNAFLSFVIALVFLVMPLARRYTLTFTPWLVVFLVSLFFFVLIVAFIHSNFDLLKSKGFAVAIIVIILAIFIISGINVFGTIISNYLSSSSIANEAKNVILQPAVLGLILLFVIGAVLSWFLSRK